MNINHTIKAHTSNNCS